MPNRRTRILSIVTVSRCCSIWYLGVVLDSCRSHKEQKRLGRWYVSVVSFCYSLFRVLNAWIWAMQKGALKWTVNKTRHHQNTTFREVLWTVHIHQKWARWIPVCFLWSHLRTICRVHWVRWIRKKNVFGWTSVRVRIYSETSHDRNRIYG